MITASNPPRFLVIQTAFIGDVILATALLEQLHQTYPTATLDILVRQGNEDLLANHPFLNEVLVWRKKGPGGVFAKYQDVGRLIRTVRSRQYDVIFCLQRYSTMGLLTVLSDAGATVGFDENPLSRLFTHRVIHKFEPGIHEVDRNAALLTALQTDTHIAPVSSGLPIIRRPRLYPTPTDYAAVALYQQQPYVCIAPRSVWFTKQYPAERWVELSQMLPIALRIYLLGAPTDADACEVIRQAAEQPERVINLAGKLTLLQSAALQQGARMNYVNDSAPLHLCSAMNAPTTAVFCSTIPEFGYGPLADDSRVVQSAELLPCRPCNIHGHSACPLGHFLCAWSIRPADLEFN